MGFGQSTANEFATETHPHPNLPLEGEGVLNALHLAKNSVAESSLQNSRISAMLCLFDVQNESR